MNFETTFNKSADTSAALHPLLAERWSPRAFDRHYRLDDQQLTGLLEAARWAPSANNSQPWRFLIARRGDDDFKRLSSILADSNSQWAEHASALVLVAAQTTDPAGRPHPWALYDTGQAVAALTFQAQADGLSIRQIGGFDTAAARHAFDLDTSVAPVVVMAIGRHDGSAQVPQLLADRERAPRSRKPVQALLLMDPKQGQRAA